MSLTINVDIDDACQIVRRMLYQDLQFIGDTSPEDEKLRQALKTV